MAPPSLCPPRLAIAPLPRSHFLKPLLRAPPWREGAQLRSLVPRPRRCVHSPPVPPPRRPPDRRLALRRSAPSPSDRLLARTAQRRPPRRRSASGSPRRVKLARPRPPSRAPRPRVNLLPLVPSPASVQSLHRPVPHSRGQPRTPQQSRHARRRRGTRALPRIPRPVFRVPGLSRACRRLPAPGDRLRFLVPPRASTPRTSGPSAGR